MYINELIVQINNIIWGTWPFVIFILATAIIVSIVLNFVQFRYFLKSWQLTLFNTEKTTGDLTPFQALANALSTGLGNGSIAGIATAIAAGGPGAAFWVFVFGLLAMSLRYAEVFLATYFSPFHHSSLVGGPMVYLAKTPGGKPLATIFAFFLLFLSFTSGNAMQANSIRLGFVHILNIPPLIIAFILLIFISYVMAGGSSRIIKVSDRIVPLKVGLFFISAFIILGYHYQALVPALKLIMQHAFCLQSVCAGAVGYMLQQAMRFGIVRSVNASETGLGTAAVFFGGTESKEPVESGIISMISAFISANLVCFMVALMIIASGVWNNGQTSLDLTISAYETVFGTLGGWIVTFLSVSFGIGVLTAYGYIASACWLYLTNGKFELLYRIIFCAITFFGALAKVEMVWNSTDIVNAGLLITNLLGILWFLPLIRKELLLKRL